METRFRVNGGRLLCVAACLLAALALGAQTRRAERGKMKVTVVATPSTKGKNAYYTGNRAPLLPNPLIKLPIGSIRPEGWVRRQLELLAEGMVGHLPELSRWARFEGSAWASKTGQGEHGWEELPYWLKGFVDLGYVLQDGRILAESMRWIESILASHRKDGYFGPESNLTRPDLWPNMLALYVLRSHYEATGDPRVLPFMSRYCRWLTTIPLEKFLPGDWQKWRGGDNLDSIYWLYNRTGARWLLELARTNHERTADWTGGIPTWHGVNLAQGFREPGQYYVQTHDPRYLKAAERNYDTIMEKYGQVPGGMYGADENARPGFTGPRQAAETCAMVEIMFSHELLLSITGSPRWADRCEEVAFNSLPAAMTPDLKGLHYLTAPNQVQLDRQSKAPLIQNSGDMFSYSPFEQYRCCQHNVAFGWPYYAEHLWMATPDNGLAATLYAASTVSAKAGDGVTVDITEKTYYPFDESVEFTLSTPKPVAFPLYLRIPGWCAQPKVALNGQAVALPASPKGWIRLEREWKRGDSVRLELPMELRVKVWEKNRHTVSVYRGPLAFSLQIGERWHNHNAGQKWAAYEVFPTTPWNYGLIVDVQNPNASFAVVKRGGEPAGQPFTPEAAPILLKAKGKRIPQWTLEANGLIGEVQPGPVRSDEPVEEITLIPMGCARLRVSAFPQIGEGPDARIWQETASVMPSASYVNPSDTVNALLNEVTPRSSSDQEIPRFTWWDHLGTLEWVQYTFTKPRKIGWCEVYWFDDEAIGGQCRLPQSWRVLWWDGAKWQPVANASEYGRRKDAPNRVTFEPVETMMLRIEVKLAPGVSGGILQWRVGS